LTRQLPSGPDDTRKRLIQAGGELFSEAGYDHVTVREICRRAGANVAAVNYHFGDKLGLYTAVILSQLQFAGEAARANTTGVPEVQLRSFVHRYLTGLMGTDRPAWVTRLTALEMARPSPALDRVVEQIVRPTEARLRELVSAITQLPADDDRVRMAAHSVVGQCLHYRHAEQVLKRLWPDLWDRKDRLAILTEHIVSFSLAGMERIRTGQRSKRGKTKTA
jgi:AcrR family transcriptional regulator